MNFDYSRARVWESFILVMGEMTVYINRMYSIQALHSRGMERAGVQRVGRGRVGRHRGRESWGVGRSRKRCGSRLDTERGRDRVDQVEMGRIGSE